MTELGYRRSGMPQRDGEPVPESPAPPAVRRPAPGDGWRAWPPVPADVSSAQCGNEAVLAAIATAAIPKLVAFYRGLGMRIHDAEDLAGDACEAMVRSLPRLRNAERFEPWFWRIARSKYYDEIRRIKRPAPPPLEREEMHDDPSDLAVLSDEHAAVRRAFGTLRPRDREVLWMRDVAGLEYGDIAGRLSVSEGAVRIAVMRARQRLAEALGQLG